MTHVINNVLIGLNNLGRVFCNYAASVFVQSALLVILLLVVDLLLRKRVRAVFRYCLWMLVLVKLVLPPMFSLPTGIGYWVGDRFPAAFPISSQAFDVAGLERASPSSEMPQVRPAQNITEIDALTAPAASALTPLTWQAVLFILWLVGVFAFLVVLVQRIKFVRGLIAASSPAKKELLDLLEQYRQQIGVRWDIRLRISDTIPSPAVCGFFRPTVLIPTPLVEKLSPEGLRATLIHELAHIKRGDLWVNSVQTFLQVVYFYNPFVWFANSVIRRICEEAVDEMVLVTLGGQAKDYSNTLIDIGEMAFWKTSLSLRLIGVVESKKALHRRIRHMLNRPIPKNTKVGMLSTIVIIIIAAVLLPMARAERPNKADTPNTRVIDTGKGIFDKSVAADATTKPAPALTLRRVNHEPGGHASISPDGKYLCDVDWDAGNLVVRNLATGKVRRLTNKASWKESGDFAYFSVISPDSKKVAYLWYVGDKDNFDLHLIGLDGSGHRVLWRSEKREYIVPAAWTPYGKQILGVLLEDNLHYIVWVSTADGSVQRIKSLGKDRPPKVDLSPDGRYVAYGREGDIFVFESDGTHETPLVRHPAKDKLLGWAPDGKHILFASDRMGTWDAWFLKVTGAKAYGFPELVRPHIGGVSPVGFTANGSYYYNLHHRARDVYVADLDLETVKVLASPMPVRQTGTSRCPDWSPSGQYLAYCVERADQRQIIRIRSLTTGLERELDPNLPSFYCLRWSPDGQSILASYFSSQAPQVFYRIDVETGKRTTLVRSETDRIMEAELSPDGKALFYRRRGRSLVVRDLETGREKELLRIASPTVLRYWALSPDGKRLALSIREDKTDWPWALKVVSAEGGKPTKLFQGMIGEIAWAADGQHILFTKQDNKLWRMPAEGGEPQQLWEWKKRVEPVHLRVHPDGRRIAFVSSDVTFELWAMENFLPLAKAGGR